MNKLPNLIFTILIAFFIQFLITGCGGGSSGTDNGGAIKIKGLIVANETPSDFKVTILETGEEALTDSEGNFEINTQEVKGNINLLVTKDNFENKVSIEIPEIDKNDPNNNQERIISITINVDTTNNLLSISSLYYSDKLNVNKKDVTLKDEDSNSDKSIPTKQKEKKVSTTPSTFSETPDNNSSESSGTVEGTLVALDGSPIVGAYISLDRVVNPINVISNIAGKFRIPFTTEEKEIRIRVNYQNQSFSTKLSRFNANQVKIKVTLLLKTSRQDIRDVYFENRDKIKTPSLKVIKEKINN